MRAIGNSWRRISRTGTGKRNSWADAQRLMFRAPAKAGAFFYWGSVEMLHPSGYLDVWYRLTLLRSERSEAPDLETSDTASLRLPPVSLVPKGRHFCRPFGARHVENRSDPRGSRPWLFTAAAPRLTPRMAQGRQRESCRGNGLPLWSALWRDIKWAGRPILRLEIAAANWYT